MSTRPDRAGWTLVGVLAAVAVGQPFLGCAPGPGGAGDVTDDDVAAYLAAVGPEAVQPALADFAAE
ncbi:MAG: hypothetical protein KC656_29225, partial [Myxococcales bacterium]|nr:hypothetical protein [Myxococcales bacterium]